MSDLSSRILILAASQKDAESAGKLCAGAGMVCTIVSNFDHLIAAIEQGAGALVIAKEVLNTHSVEKLRRYLDVQPKWSFLPLILLAAAGDLSKGSSTIVQLLSPLRNLTLLERPVRVSTLISVIKAALSDRERQYEVRDLLGELEISKAKAVAASEAKSAFLANMSHEIRTPLGIILGFSDFLLDPEIPAGDKAFYADTIRRNGHLLSSLIDDVLDLAKVESGHLSIEKIDVSSRELLSDVITAMQPKAFVKKIGLSLSIKPEVPWIIKTDVVRFKQILINVIGNALKFTSHGEISLMVDCVDTKLKVLISDTGIGISPEQARGLFSAFSQADSSITRRFGGTGLGLVLSKRIAEALGGDLILKNSVVGQGSQFEVTIDAGLTEIKSKIPDYDAPRAVLNVQGKRVLVVDDSRDNQILLSRLLSKAGIEVSTADDGQEAIDRLAGNSFDVVLMDVQMPRLGGYEAVTQLRKNGYAKPIIALTAHAFKEDRDRAFAVGCNAYLTKPIDKTKLLEAIEDLVEVS